MSVFIAACGKKPEYKPPIDSVINLETVVGNATETSLQKDQEKNSSSEASLNVDKIPDCQVPVPPYVGTRRLTNLEISRSLHYAFGIKIDDILKEFPESLSSTGLASTATTDGFSEIFIGKISHFAYGIADRIYTHPTFQPNYIGVNCDRTEQCRNRIIEALLLTMYRRPPNDLERLRYRKLFETIKNDPQGSFEIATRAVIAALLQSAAFLYRIEPNQGPSGKTRPLNDYEMASRLSFFIWQSSPDAELYDLAKAGKLNTEEQIQSQALKMIEDKRAWESFNYFVQEWFSLQQLHTVKRDVGIHPQFSPGLMESMRREVLFTFSDLAFSSKESLLKIIRSDFSFLDQKLADFYGFDLKIDEMQKVDLAGSSERFGLVTMGGVLNSISAGDDTSPVARGLYFQKTLLCTEIPNPPPEAGAFDEEIAIPADATPREKFAIHRSKESCATCHDLMDPFGLGLETYDAIGNYRKNYQTGKPIDPSGSFKTALGVDDFSNVKQLSEILVEHEGVKKCFTQKFYQLGTGFYPENKHSCEISRNLWHIKNENFTYESFVINTVKSPSFRTLGFSD